MRWRDREAAEHDIAVARPRGDPIGVHTDQAHRSAELQANVIAHHERTHPQTHGVTRMSAADRAPVRSRTLLVLHDRYPSKEALDAALGSYEGMQETLDQLDELLVTLGARVGRS